VWLVLLAQVWAHWGLNWFFLPDSIFAICLNFQQQNLLKNQYLLHLRSEVNSINSNSQRAFQQQPGILPNSNAVFSFGIIITLNLLFSNYVIIICQWFGSFPIWGKSWVQFLEISTLYDQHFLSSWLALLRINVKHQLWVQYLLEQGNLSLGVWEHFELNHKLQNLTLHFEGFSKFHLLHWRGS
jgi:hypothetical protein